MKIHFLFYLETSDHGGSNMNGFTFKAKIDMKNCIEVKCQKQKVISGFMYVPRCYSVGA